MSKFDKWREAGRNEQLRENLALLLRAGWEGKFDSDTDRNLDLVLEAMPFDAMRDVKLAEYFEKLAKLIRESCG